MTSTEHIKLFLSYAMKDDGNTPDDPQKSLMRRLYNDLTTQNFDVWWDHVSMPSRSIPMSKEIEDALRDCDRFVLIVGEHLRESGWVQGEIAYAHRLCKPITLIFRSGTLEHFPDGMDSTRALDFRPPRDYAPTFEGLVDRLRQDAPIGKAFNVRPLPDFLLDRPAPFHAARESVCATSISPTVISAPAASTAISGYAGIGKSTLAVMLAHDCDIRRFFKDGIIWVSVGQTPVITELQAQIGVNVFGDSRENYQNADDGRAALSRVLHDKAALLILDDVWDRYLVDQFPTTGTTCRLLITTRNRTLAGQIDGSDILLGLLTDREGAALIARRVGGSADNPIYQQIARLLGGHTLAIRIASEQLASHYADSAADLLHLLTKRDNIFKHLKLTEDNKDENVERSLSLSYSALQPDMQQRFRALGVLAVDSTFNRSKLAAVWKEVNGDKVRLPLSVLIATGLINDEGEGHYRQHRLLRAYAHALLTEAGEFDSIFARYADDVIADEAEFNAFTREILGKFDTLLSHTREVGDTLVNEWAQQGSSPNAALLKRCGEFAYNVRRYIHNRPQMIDTPRGRERLGLSWLEMGLAVSRYNQNRENEALFQNEISDIWKASGEKSKALSALEEALPLMRSAGDQSGEATTLNNTGEMWRTLGNPRKALEYFEQALLIHRSESNYRSEAATLHNIGAVWDDLGEKRKALDYYELALPLAQTIGNRRGESTILNNLGELWRSLGEPRKALDYFEQALQLHRIVGSQQGEATTLNNIGAVWDALGAKRKALEYYELALPLSQAVGDREGEATTLNNMGTLWNTLGEKDKALSYFKEALSLKRAVSDRRGEATTLNNLAVLYSQTGEFENTVETFQQSIQIFHELSASAEEAGCLFNIAYVYEQIGRGDEAIQAAETGKAILVSHNLPQDAWGTRIAQYDALLIRVRGQHQPKRGLWSQIGNALRGKRE